MEVNGGHVRGIRTSSGTSGEREFFCYPIDLRIVSHDPVKANEYVAADVQDEEVSHFGVTTDVQSYRDVFRNWTSLIGCSIGIIGLSWNGELLGGNVMFENKRTTHGGVRAATVEEGQRVEGIAVLRGNDGRRSQFPLGVVSCELLQHSVKVLATVLTDGTQ